MDSPWLEALGRLHPLLVHLPIGLWVGAAAIEFGGLLLRRRAPRGAVCALAWLAFLGSAAAVGTGWLLSGEGGYDEPLADLHRSLALATAGAGLLTAITALLPKPLPFRMFLLATLGLIAATAHFGGSLAHGETWLTDPFRAKEPERPATPPEANQPADPPPPPPSFYAAQIAPVLERDCYACHGARKHKSDLSLHTPEAIGKGGKNGAVLAPGKPGESDLLQRALLPLDDDDHMPPKGKPQPTPAELATLRRWISGGAPFTGDLVEDAAPAPGVPNGPDEGQGTQAPAEGVAAQPAALTALHDALVHAAPVAQGSPLLWIDFAAIAVQLDDQKLAPLLEPVLAQASELGLARTKIADASLALVARAPNLKKLDLRGTTVTAAGLAHLEALPLLQDLILAQTKVGDAAVEHLLAMPALRRVFLWDAGLSPEGLARLRAKDGLAVDAGDTPPAAAAEVEGVVQFTKVGDAPAPAAPAAAPAAELLRPINDICPVSGKPVDPKFIIVHEGRVIGFCCPNCPKLFWAEPAKYPVKAR